MVTMVARCTGSLSQLPVVERSWGKKCKKKPSVLINFRFLVNFIRHTGPMVTMVTRCTGRLSQLLVVEMSWGKKSKKKPNVLTNFHLLVYFIIHTGHMVTAGQQLRILHLLSPINFFQNFSHFCDHHRLMLHWRKLFSKESDLLPQF